MREIMDWKSCKEKFIRDVEPDPERIRSIQEIAALRLKYVKNAVVDKDNVSFILEGYYNVIKELLIALLLSNGLRSKNHQCLISYFYYNHEGYEAEAHLISQMDYLKNRLDYYGEPIEIEFYEKNKVEFGKIIGVLNNLIKQKLKEVF